MTVEESRTHLQEFANKHKIIFQDKGECGFGRPCVGLLHGNNYVDFNPTNRNGDYIWPEDERLYPPAKEVPNAYHKHDCLAVLVHNDDYDEAILELDTWIRHLESLCDSLFFHGELVIEEYQTGDTGMQALITGVFGHAIRIKEVAPETTEVKEEVKIQIKAPLEFSNERISDLLCCALEGGSNYWYLISQVNYPEGKTDKDYKFPCLEVPLDEGGSITIIDVESQGGDKPAFDPVCLNRAAIHDGLELMAETRAKDFDNFLKENEDADTGDVFLQLCCFGEIMFG